MTPLCKRITLGAAILSLTVGLSTPAASAESVGTSLPDDIKVFESPKSGTPDIIKSQGMTTDRVSDSTASPMALICQFDQRVDWAHISSTSTQRAVQSHGNWGNKNCNYTLARVKTQIDKRNFLGAYYAVGTPGVGDLPPKSSLTSTGRVTGRYVCNGTKTNSFRSWTDVDVYGILDAPNKVYSTPRDLDCG